MTQHILQSFVSCKRAVCRLFGYIASVQVKIMAKSKASASKETKIITEKGGTNIYDYVSLKELPNFADLNIALHIW
jgi:hypothetical protein